MNTESGTISFRELGLASHLLQTLEAVGYEAPTPIQAQSIPVLLSGQDLLGQAQTGTGKTGAFALPLLSNLDLHANAPQILVLTPTRELAIQVSEAFQTYARNLDGFRVVPIYGGQSMSHQLNHLKRGAHVVVGTPGRLMDHLRRKSLHLDSIKALVLDEADEMLKMGFIEDIEWILEHTPAEKQVALFSATMPPAIRKVARTHLKEAQEIHIESKTSTVETIRQQYWLVSGLHKLDALTRILEVEDGDATLIFVRTKNATVDLAEKLEARGYSAAALNGDVTQQLRERTIQKLKNGELDVVVATDVAARGLDVERISHVINYDIPYDTESYVHRIGRTGRAGRSGSAILFVAPREKRMLATIERATKQKMEAFELPTKKEVSLRRIERFKERLLSTVQNHDLSFYSQIINELSTEAE
ncbi:MAG: DEAD/DEAH box helicase, partial [Bdellovibrionales bacterium]|nr:DEAD/DEAH box helicase [Bdellovibrionales bacterium]